MAVEAYLVAFDIQEAGSGYQLAPKTGLGSAAKGKAGIAEYEGNGTTEPGLLGQGIKGNVARCLLAEVEAESAAEAVSVVREIYSQNAGGERAVVKPNKTNFKVVT